MLLIPTFLFSCSQISSKMETEIPQFLPKFHRRRRPGLKTFFCLFFIPELWKGFYASIFLLGCLFCKIGSHFDNLRFLFLIFFREKNVVYWLTYMNACVLGVKRWKLDLPSIGKFQTLVDSERVSKRDGFGCCVQLGAMVSNGWCCQHRATDWRQRIAIDQHDCHSCQQRTHAQEELSPICTAPQTHQQPTGATHILTNLATCWDTGTLGALWGGPS